MFKPPKKYIDSESFFDFLNNENKNINIKEIKTEIIKEQEPIEISENKQKQKEPKIYQYVGDDIPWLF